MELEQLKFPVGKLDLKNEYSGKEIGDFIEILRYYPGKYRNLLRLKSEEDLEAQYREGSWTALQVMHHVADMHILHYARFKFALTEDNPVGVVAKINAWANLEDSRTAPVKDSLLLLEGTHLRWAYLAEQMNRAEFERTFFHPLRQDTVTLAQALALGAWHTRHHFNHLRLAFGKGVEK